MRMLITTKGGHKEPSKGEIAEQLAAERASYQLRDLDHAEVGQRAGHGDIHTMPSVPSVESIE